MSGTTSGYQLRFRVTGTSMWSDYGPIVSTLTEAIVGLTPGVQYDVEVLSINSNGTVASQVVTFTMGEVAPSSPGQPVVSQITSSGAVVNWPQAVTGTQTITYQLYAGPHGGVLSPIGQPSTLTSAVLTNLTPSTAYDVDVVAINEAGNSMPSPVASFTTPAVGPLPTNWSASITIKGQGTFVAGFGRNLSGATAISGVGHVTVAAQVSNKESTNGSTLTTTTGVIYDASINVWSLVSSASNGLQIAENGVTQSSTSNVSLLLLWNNVMYYQSGSSWFQWNGSAWIAAAGDPRINESPNNTVLTTTTGTITSANDDQWALVVQQAPPSGQGRDPFLQPFAATDFWNAGIGSGAQWTAASDTATAKLITLNGMINSNGNFNQPYYLGTGSDVLLTLHCVDTQIFPMADQQIRVPVGATPSVGGDAHMNFFDRTNPGKMYSLYQCVVNNADGNGGVTVNTTQISCQYAGMYDATGSGVYPFGDTAFPTVGTGNVGYDNYGIGAIRDWEMTAGVIDHALRYSLSTDAVSSPGNYFNLNIPWPNAIEDYCGPPTQFTGCAQQEYNGIIPWGATIGIPSTVNLAALGLSAGGLMLARCLQKYGAVIRDTGGTNQLTFYTETVSPANTAMINNQIMPDMPKIVPLLRIMTNQGATNINGGGSYPPSIGGIAAQQGAVINSVTTGGVTTAVPPNYIFDAQGNQWSLAAAASGNGLGIVHTGVLDAVTQNVILLLYWNGQMYQEIVGNVWYVYTPGTGWVQIVGDPRTTSNYIFDDEFTSAPWLTHRTWQAGDNWLFCSTQSTDGRGGTNFNEFGDQWWVNPNNPSTPISGLYTLVNSQLVLSLLPTPSGNQAYITAQAGEALPFVGCLLSSQDSMLRTFFYVEIEVAVQRVPGFCFQMDMENYPVDGVFPPEIDFDIGTDQAGVQHVQFNIHTNLGSYITDSTKGFDARAFHTYGINWQQDFITCYIDGVQVLQIATPSPAYTAYRQYLYLLTAANYMFNQGDPTNASLPASATIAYVRVSANKVTSPPEVPRTILWGGSSDPTFLAPITADGFKPGMSQYYCTPAAAVDDVIQNAFQWYYQTAINNFASPGTLPMWDIGMAVSQASANGDFAAIAAGTYDDIWNTIVANTKAQGIPTVYIRPAWEMNGTWFPWSVNSGNTANFIAAWRHMYATFHAACTAQGITGLVVYCPTQNADDSLCFPGAAYIDIIAVDVGSNSYSGVPNNFSTGNGPVSVNTQMTRCEQFGLPFGISELAAITNNGDWAALTQNVYAAMQLHPSVVVDHINFVNYETNVNGGDTLFQNYPADNAAVISFMTNLTNRQP